MFDLKTLSPTVTQDTASMMVAPRNESINVNVNSGVSNIGNGITFDIFTIPSSLTFTTASNNGTGAASITQKIFNNTTFGDAITTNGSGAASIVNTYGDGFTGKVYERLFSSANGGKGVLITGFTVVSTVGGSQSSTPFNTIALTLNSANGQGSLIPVNIDLSEAIRNTQFLSGTLTVNKSFYMNSLQYLSALLPANTTFAFTFFTNASGFKG